MALTDSNKITTLKERETDIPLIALRDVVIFPYTEIPLTFGRVKSNLFCLPKKFADGNSYGQ